MPQYLHMSVLMKFACGAVMRDEIEPSGLVSGPMVIDTPEGEAVLRLVDWNSQRLVFEERGGVLGSPLAAGNLAGTCGVN